MAKLQKRIRNLYLSFFLSVTTLTAEKMYKIHPGYQVLNPTYPFGPYSSFEFVPVSRRISQRYTDRRHPSIPLKAKKVRFESEDYDDDEDDNPEETRSYTVGTKINVQHPQPEIKYFKKEGQKAVSYTNFHIAHDEAHGYNNKRAPKPGLPKKQIFKSVQEIENDEFEFSPSFEYDDDDKKDLVQFPLQKVPNLYPTKRDYGRVASKGQLVKYLEDQRKHIDEEIEYQLLNDPNPKAKAKYQQYLKSKDDERIEKEYEEELRRKPHSLFRPNESEEFKIRPPRKFEQQRPRKTNIFRQPSSPGLGNFRTGRKAPKPIHFKINI